MLYSIDHPHQDPHHHQLCHLQDCQCHQYVIIIIIVIVIVLIMIIMLRTLGTSCRCHLIFSNLCSDSPSKFVVIITIIITIMTSSTSS